MKEKIEKKMTEHPDTVAEVRKDFMAQVHRWFIAKYGDKEECLYYCNVDYDWQGMLDNCTTLQLRALCKLFDREIPTLKILRCNPLDHLSVTFAGMYVGIEPDGYTHS